MFDFDRIAENVGGLFGQTAMQADAGALAQALGEIGIDVAGLQGLEPQQIAKSLTDAGLDISHFDAGQIEQLAGQGGAALPLSEMLARILNRGG